MEHTTYHFDFLNTKFFAQYWQPENPKAVVVLVHGMAEYSSKYENTVVPVLIENNYAVIGFDHFGHGKTQGKRGWCPSYDAVLDVMALVIDKAEMVYPNLPNFLYGHSMGGNVVLNFVLRREHRVKAVVASSAFLQLAFQPPKWKLAMGKILQKIAPSITLKNEINPNHISRIPEVVTQYEQDPLIHDKISASYSLSFIESGKWAIENAGTLTIPTILIHGTGDAIIAHQGSVDFADQSELATLKLYDNGYHELHNDLCKEQVMQDVVDWLQKQV